MKRDNIILALIITLSLSICSYGQVKQPTQNQVTQNQSQMGSTSTNMGSMNNKINPDATDLISQLNTQSLQQNFTPVDKAVNPEKYIVGPNDAFMLGLVGYLNQNIPLRVNVEGSLVIPSVGEIKVDGLSLSEAKNKVIKAVKHRYYSSDVSLTLVNPRIFLISVQSTVQKKLEVTSVNRPSDVISMIFYDTLDISKTKYYLNNPKNDFSTDISLRNIEIVHKDGSVSGVDLYRYFETNDDRYNPTFVEGDLLKVPYGQLIKNYVTIDGAVQLGGVYEYNKNDDLESVIFLGRGFDADAEQDSISVFRIDPLTSKYTCINLSYQNDKKFKINVFDRVFVKYKLNNIKNLSVLVLGEVNRPGIYPITQKNTSLREVIEMAGGFKPNAYMPLSLLTRKYDEEYTKKDTAEIFLNIRANDLIVKEQDRKNFDIDVLSRRYRMIVDFEKLFKKNDLSEDVILENRDIVYINDDKQVVYVYGQVENEGYVKYKEGENYEYYIKKAGGYSLAAEESETRIIRFNSRGWFNASETPVHSGDFIYVPKVVKTPFNENLTLIATAIGALVSIISTYLLIRNTK